MKHSESIKELATALAKAQGDMQDAKKDSDNPYYNSKYADLAAVWRACRSALSKNGLSVSQGNELINGQLHLISLLMHESGEWLRSEMILPLPDPDAVEYNKAGKTVKKNMLQAIASAMTYVRRITLSGLVGVAPDDDTDDDAEATREAVDTKKQEEKKKQAAADQLPAIDLQELEKFIKENKLRDQTEPMTIYLSSLAYKKDMKRSEMFEYCFRNRDGFFKAFKDHQQAIEKKALKQSISETMLEEAESLSLGDADNNE